MFVSLAHSFRQQARLAITLAWVAGYTDTLTLILCGAATSHATGNTANFGRNLFSHPGTAAFLLFLLASFFLGAGISGLCTEFARRRNWESIYVLPMAIEGLLLGLTALLLEFNAVSPDPLSPSLFAITGLASAAMGLQNATITHISSGQVRTTHVTGVLTDLGQESVQFLSWLWTRNRNVPPASATSLVHNLYHHPTSRRLALLASILGSFAFGAGLGTVASLSAPRHAMFIPVLFFIWMIYQDITQPIAEVENSSLVNVEHDLNLPPALAVFHLRKDHDRKGRVHRMPNLLAWSERLPAAILVVVLDLGEVRQLDSNAVLELRALLARFTKQGRTLILSGINPEQFARLNAVGLGDLLDLENVCPDLELAIARGLNHLHPQQKQSP